MGIHNVVMRKHLFFLSFQVIWNDLCVSTREVMTAAEFIDQQATDLAQCRAAQIDLSAKISLIMAIERLADKISSRPNAVDSFWLVSYICH